ncbi:regulatory protein RecX [Xanthovirga aplysinae]|uniref:regulatory protein RecX n=1 Tax=Xanthovirga aplysinae TaxID=2529853 RepID=UPI0012BCD448|nr:regulatory protein RecX [Xanthovirga aplysinae]MTI31718.1 regulatory protein RecX [Xanthovirga aplysinae]
MIGENLIREKQEAKTKAQSFCAYRERSRKEVKHKLQEIGVSASLMEIIIDELEQENFLNEERYARSFAGGKFRINKWGKQKIRLALNQQGIGEHFINQGLKEIDTEEYMNLLFNLAEKKSITEKETNPLKRKQKLMRYLMGKGFEADLVQYVLNQLES